MRLCTASEVISLARKLEDVSAKFYEDLSGKYAGDEDILLSFPKENRKNTIRIERAYYEVISDAIEGCFAFDLDSDEYKIETSLPLNSAYADALRRAIDMEEKIVKFYVDSAEQSRSLMADVPRAFAAVAKGRNSRILKLKALIEKKG